ncbi:hypothetical protein [Cytobacillus firmus]|uniref:hypothetical protein n=1 Tax=Cytobacillus firmus TaxID=1399 RepID=UPI0018CE8B09|nr:hypothetical protein [Cytobacillus firmus]MBG9585557.1 hypothetical protein [Cytobacillus firmus]MBG9585618.1 hypothetical protein [Cytobacillus firmus]MBG9586921.1 hypothetical protein [Cytobacillus firmus]MBG9587415.1 hypothetical protein [Cytobacillus firmus]
MGLEKYPGDIVTGKRFASGTAMSSGSTKGFLDIDGVNRTFYFLTVTGLEFTPKRINVYTSTGYPAFSINISQNIPIFSGNKLGTVNGTTTQVAYIIRLATSYGMEINSNGFTIPIGFGSQNMIWEAFGE